MPPLIGVTTSEVRRGELATLRRHGEPPQHEMALGLTYMRAIELAGGVPVVLPPLENGLSRCSTRLDGICLSGGPDLDPAAYGARAHELLGPTEPALDRFEIELARAADAAGMPLLGVCRGAQALNVARGGTLHQHIEGHRQTELACQPVHSVRIAPRSRVGAAPRRRTAPRSTPSTTRRSTCSATASSRPRGRPTARSRRSRIRAIRSCSASSGTPRRWSRTGRSSRCSARSSTPQAPRAVPGTLAA